MRKIVLSFILFFVSLVGIAQQVTSEKYYVLPGVIVDDDTLAVIHIRKVYVFPKLKFNNREEYLYYKKLVRDVKKVYPYAKIAKKIFTEIQMVFDSLPEGRKQKKYIKAKEDELLGLYAQELKSFTIRQGQILIKLVDRELSQSSYEIIKEIRGGFSAIMWQGVAKLFGESLKTTYDAQGEDLLIERIVISIEQGTI